jgi:hypothetical protein
MSHAGAKRHYDQNKKLTGHFQKKQHALRKIPGAENRVIAAAEKMRMEYRIKYQYEKIQRMR